MKTILIVDDIQVNRYMLKVIVQAEGYDVIEASDGKEALDIAHQACPGLIIADILMPEMDGFQLCRECKADETLREVPFIFYTATYTDAQDEKLALSLGADLFLRKPQEPAVIAKEIKKVIWKKQQRTKEETPTPVTTQDQTAYENVLFRKLEKKVMELERANAELEQQIAKREKAEEARMTLEKQLRHVQRLEAIGTLSGGIAHDFNNILNGILGYAEIAEIQILSKPVSADDIKEAARFLETIMQICKKGAALVRQIRTFSTEAEQKFCSILLHEHVRDALKLLHGSLPSNIIIEENIDSDSGSIMGDPAQIHQLVVNLCVNGFEAMDKPSGGKLTVFLKEEMVDKNANNLIGFCGGKYLVLRVSDTGKGITPELKERIFEPYFTTKKMSGGTGLGLAVVHGIVQSHQAAIDVESHPDRGTTFTVYFHPESELSKTPKLAKPSTCPQNFRGQERVLFVDDSRINADLGKKGLESLGYTVTAFASSEEALRAYRATPDAFDIAITDLTMSGLSGEALVNALVKTRPDMKIILYTGATTNGVRLPTHPNIKEILSKPLSPSILASAIRRVMGPKK